MTAHAAVFGSPAFFFTFAVIQAAVLLDGRINCGTRFGSIPDIGADAEHRPCRKAGRGAIQL